MERIGTATQIHFHLGRDDHSLVLHARSGLDFDVIELMAGLRATASLSIFFHRGPDDAELADANLVDVAIQLENVAAALRRSAQARLDALQPPAVKPG